MVKNDMKESDDERLGVECYAGKNAKAKVGKLANLWLQYGKQVDLVSKSGSNLNKAVMNELLNKLKGDKELDMHNNCPVSQYKSTSAVCYHIGDNEPYIYASFGDSEKGIKLRPVIYLTVVAGRDKAKQFFDKITEALGQNEAKRTYRYGEKTLYFFCRDDDTVDGLATSMYQDFKLAYKAAEGARPLLKGKCQTNE